MKNLMPTNVPGLVKEKNGVMVVNTNVGQYKNLLARRNKLREEKQLRTEVNILKKELSELRNSVQELINQASKVTIA